MHRSSNSPPPFPALSFQLLSVVVARMRRNNDRRDRRDLISRLRVEEEEGAPLLFRNSRTRTSSAVVKLSPFRGVAEARGGYSPRVL